MTKNLTKIRMLFTSILLSKFSPLLSSGKRKSNPFEGGMSTPHVHSDESQAKCLMKSLQSGF